MPKNILVLATASRTGGALTIFLQFIDAVRAARTGDRYFIFADPEMPQPPADGITYIPYNTAGWRRVFFDVAGFRRAVKRLGVRPDLIVSFQNTGVRYAGVPQVIYFHNLLPLVPCRWSPFRKAERTLFFYSALYPAYVRLLLRKDAEVVVQANFLKALFEKRFRHDAARVHVLPPPARLPDTATIAPYPFEPGKRHFLYPAAAHGYKRHDTLIEMLRILWARDEQTAQNVCLHLTVSPDERPALTDWITAHALQDHILLHGALPYETILSMYASADGLLFPSELETLGLPLLEAAAFGLPVLVADLPYAREALAGYEGATFLSPARPQDWAKALEALPRRRFAPFRSTSNDASWERFLRLLRDKQ